MAENLVERSLEIAAGRCADLTPLVYRRLFEAHPETEAMFWRDRDGAIKGEMLARVLDAVLDFSGERLYGSSLIQCEVVRHEGEMETPPALFRRFFAVVGEAVREAAGSDWTPEMGTAWSQLLSELDFYVDHPDQAATLAGAAA